MRSAVADLSGQPIRNLLANPSLASSDAGWTGTSGNRSRVAASGSRSGFVYRSEITAAGALYFYAGTADAALAPPARAGETVFGIARVRQTAGTPSSFHARIVARTAAGGGVADLPGPATPLLALNRWVWVQISAIMPAGASRAQLQIRADVNVAAGDVFEVDSAMLTTGGYSGPYLDGDAPGWTWTGTAGASESGGYPLPPFFAPNPDTLAESAAGYQAGIIDRSDSRVPAGMPFAKALHLGGFDSRLLWQLGAVPYSLGTQDWVVEGWLAAVDAVATSGTAAGSPNLDRFRFGTSYGNDGPNGLTTTSVIRGTTLARADFLNVWKPFQQIYRINVPANANLGGYFCPNMSGQGWLLSGGRFRRAAPGELVV